MNAVVSSGKTDEKIGSAEYPILGISYAGLLAITFAAKYPELTQKLILVVSAYKNSTSGIEVELK